jgi:UDP-N-acetylmuramoyl-L-alanyl-D-glutamate--2,6-diaminopimelate ligase
VTQDSAAVVPGALYCCISGAHVDGHDLAPSVVAAGAGSLLVERFIPVNAPQVRVPDTRRAIGPVAAAFYGHPSQRLAVIGVTGTNGKTTTTHLLAAACEAGGRPAAVIGTLSGGLTTPEAPTLQRELADAVAQGRTAVAMEVSSIALDQHRADAIAFAIGVWTNLSQDHLDYHGTMEAYFEAKARLFSADRTAKAVVNADDPFGRRLLERLAIPASCFSADDAKDLHVEVHGSRFYWRGVEVALRLGGRHNVLNALAAATAAAELGIAAADIAAGLASVSRIAGRWELIDCGQPFSVLVDYAHTPDGLEHVLRSARGAGSGRLLVVFGCGGDRDRTKRPLMGAVATRLADVAVLTTDNPRDEEPGAIIQETAAGTVRPDVLVIEPDRASAIALALDRAEAGDVVVIAGKGHETTQVVGERVLPFDDREVAAAALRRRWGDGGR